LSLKELYVNWNEWTFGRKCAATFAALGLASGIMMYFSPHGASTIGDQIRTLSAVASKLPLMSSLQGELANLRIAQQGAVMYAIAKQADKVEESRREFDYER
jgi:hypothetical protein